MNSSHPTITEMKLIPLELYHKLKRGTQHDSTLAVDSPQPTPAAPPPTRSISSIREKYLNSRNVIQPNKLATANVGAGASNVGSSGGHQT